MLAERRGGQVDLVPGGSNRAVTSANRLEYVNRVAKHHLVDGVKVISLFSIVFKCLGDSRLG